MSKAAIVSFSGGQDSTTCLFWALKNFDRVETVGFNYGQKNNVELICRKEILKKIQTQFPNFACRLGPDLVIDASTFGQVSSSALTGSGEAIVSEGKRGLPSSFVPARNLMFMTYIGARAYLRDIHTIITGVGQADFSGYGLPPQHNGCHAKSSLAGNGLARRNCNAIDVQNKGADVGTGSRSGWR